MRLPILLVGAMLTLSPFAYAKGPRSTHASKSSACFSRAYNISSMFRCGGDEFLAPDFSVSTSLCRGESAGVAIVGFNNGSGTGTHLLAKKIARSCFGPPYTKWADSRRCPQLNAVENSRGKLVLPRLMLKTDREIGELDGAFFELQLSGFYPNERAGVGVTLTGQDISPVGKWVTAAFKALQSCWSDRRPPR